MNLKIPKLRNGKPAAIADDARQLGASVDRLPSLGLKTVYPDHGKPFRWG
jgi:hypothetical protein